FGIGCAPLVVAPRTTRGTIAKSVFMAEDLGCRAGVVAVRSRGLREYEMKPLTSPDVAKGTTEQESSFVFVVDDDVSVRESLELLILSAGFPPRTFASAGDFLASPRIVAPSCLVLDVHLLDQSGLDLQRCVSADRMDMPIIFITGYGDVPMTVQAM